MSDLPWCRGASHKISLRWVWLARLEPVVLVGKGDARTSSTVATVCVLQLKSSGKYVLIKAKICSIRPGKLDLLFRILPDLHAGGQSYLLFITR